MNKVLYVYATNIGDLQKLTDEKVLEIASDGWKVIAATTSIAAGDHGISYLSTLLVTKA